jgi:hypothetical protein
MIIPSAALARKPKPAADATPAAGATYEDSAVCEAVSADAQDVSSDACAVNLPPERNEQDAPGIEMAAASDDPGQPRSMKELQQALRDLNKLGDDTMAPCDGGDLSIRGEIDNLRNLIVTPMDIGTIRAVAGDERPHGRVIIQLCPAAAENVRKARLLSAFHFYRESIPMTDGKIAINADGEISIDRPTLKQAEIEAELMRRSCVVECSWSQ